MKQKEMRDLLAAATKGMDIAVPAPPLPEQLPCEDSAAVNEPQDVVEAPAASARDRAATEFVWQFLTSESDVVSVLQARCLCCLW